LKLPPYPIFPEIKSDIISLRQIMKSDLEGLIEISYYNSVQAKTSEQAAEMLDQITSDYFNGETVHWGIAENSENKIIGTCGYYRGFDKGEGELGCILLPQYRGQGFMNSAMKLAIEFGKNHIGLKKVWAITTHQNEKAIKLLDRLNFVKVAELSEDRIEYELILGEK